MENYIIGVDGWMEEAEAEKGNLKGAVAAP